MRVLVTRPALSGARTAKKLQARGHEPVLLPLTVAVHDLEATQAGLATSGGALAVTSAEAIRVLQTLAAAGTPQAAGNIPRLPFERPLFAVGRATAERAVEIGFSIVHHANGGGAALADCIADRRLLLGGQPLTYLAGLPRASGFEERLAAHGIAFDSIDCYRMAPIAPPETATQSLFGDRPVDAILFYSRHTAARFFDLALVARHIDRLKNTRLLCLSATIATIVPYALHSQVEIAATPEEDSLLHLLDADASANLL